MQIWSGLAEVPADFGRTTVAIGNFDGVHRGHQYVLQTAAGHGLPVVAVTFDPHPVAFLRPDQAPAMLLPMSERCRLLSEHGADAVLVLPFNADLAALTAQEFVEQVLVDALKVRWVVVGEDFRFGNRAAGDVTLLRELGEQHDFEVDGLKPLGGEEQRWSSTHIRNCLRAGELDLAAEALGRPYSVTGPVVRGEQRGADLGYPTANIATDQPLPADGVYAGWLHVGEDRYPAAVSVGTNPTFGDGRERTVEAYAIDEDGLDLYDREVTLEFVSRLRGMRAFSSEDELIAQMARDVDWALDVLE